MTLQKTSAQLPLFESSDATPGWNVRISARARRLTVRVYPGGRVEVVAPRGATPATIARFVGSHRQWIDERVADLSAIAVAPAEVRPATIRLAGVGRTITAYYRTAQGPVSIESFAGDTIVVSGRIADDRAVTKALRNWLMDLARDEFSRRLRDIADREGFRFDRVQIRRQRTRWGSCSASGTISLNVCALFQSPDEMRYLFIHELSHTRQMNHSARFWALVESLEPDYQRLDRELSQGWRQVPGWMF
jgi:predicted metal-dependent hydrolase